MAVRKLCINNRCRKPEARCKCGSKATWRYQVDVKDLSGKRIRLNFKKKKEAQAEEAKYVAMKAENRSVLDVKKDYKTIFDELADKYEKEIKHQIAYKSYKKAWLANLCNKFSGQRLSEIKFYDLQSYHRKFKETANRLGSKPSRSTSNKHINMLTQMFRMAVEWDLIEKSPFDGKRGLRQKENNKRLRFASKAEIALLHIASPPHLWDIIETAINTGMRRGELFNLKWGDIAGGFIHVKETKSDESRQVPINKAVARVFQRIKKRQMRQGKRCVYVFTYKGKKISSNVQTSFENAVKKAELVDFRFHDLRHTFASHYVMKGGSIKSLQEILGHKDITMTMRYAHLSEDYTRDMMEKMCDLTDVTQMSPTDKATKLDTPKLLK